MWLENNNASHECASLDCAARVVIYWVWKHCFSSYVVVWLILLIIPPGMLSGASFTSQMLGSHYLQNVSDDSNFGQKCVRRLKNRLKYLSVWNIYSMHKVNLCSSSKGLTFLCGANSSWDTALVEVSLKPLGYSETMRLSFSKMLFKSKSCLVA